MSVFTSLDGAELALAERIAEARMRRARRRKLRNAYGATAGIELHRAGARGELAAAKVLGIAHHVERTFEEAKLGDLLGGVEVRTSRRPNGDLIIHPRDPDDRPFVLVRGPQGPSYEIVGWCMGRDGKRPEFWRDPARGRPAYFVPAKVLDDIEMFEMIPPAATRRR